MDRGLHFLQAGNIYEVLCGGVRAGGRSFSMRTNAPIKVAQRWLLLRRPPVLLPVARHRSGPDTMPRVGSQIGGSGPSPPPQQRGRHRRQAAHPAGFFAQLAIPDAVHGRTAGRLGCIAAGSFTLTNRVANPVTSTLNQNRAP